MSSIYQTYVIRSYEITISFDNFLMIFHKHNTNKIKIEDAEL